MLDVKYVDVFNGIRSYIFRHTCCDDYYSQEDYTSDEDEFPDHTYTPRDLRGPCMFCSIWCDCMGRCLNCRKDM
jgi:hypothetical protein